MSENAVQYYRSAFERLDKQAVLPWFADERESAIRQLEETGFPTIRQENWKYTDVRPIIKRQFNPDQTGTRPGSDELAEVRFENLDCYELVFVNGQLSPSGDRKFPQGVVIDSLAASGDRHAEVLNRHLGRYSGKNEGAFPALNTAFFRDGALLILPDNMKLDKPVCLIYFSTDSDSRIASHPHNLIVLGKNASAAVIEYYVGKGENDYLTNTVTEVITDDASHLTHYKIQQEGKKGFHIGNLVTRQEKDSRIDSHSISLGGRLVRNDIVANLAAEGSGIRLNGLYLASGRQHVDNHTLVNHLKPHTWSDEIYRGVMNDHGRAVFNGKVIVHKNAQQSDAQQSNANLLLSDNAEADTKPELEIYADDVKCSHGATVGKLDEGKMFYLRTRGIDEETARSFLIYAFAEDVINKIDISPVKERLESLIIGRLPEAEKIREFSE